MFGGEVCETAGWSSARGNHLVFLWNDRLAKYRKAIVSGHANYPGLDLRFGWSEEGKQYQSVVPPSLSGDGQQRRWGEHLEILPLPESVYADLDRYDTVEPKRPKLKIDSGRDRTSASKLERSPTLDKCQPAISGQAGHNQAFKVACKIGPGFDLSPDTAFRLIRHHFNERCEPPWSEKELKHKVEDAYVAETRRGWLLTANSAGGGKSRTDDEDEDAELGESEEDPHRLARLYLDKISTPDGQPTLWLWLEEWHRWDGSRYRVISDAEIRAGLVNHIKAEFDRIARSERKIVKHVSMRVVSNTLQSLSGLCLLSASQCHAQPAWLDAAGEDLPDPIEVLLRG